MRLFSERYFEWWSVLVFTVLLFLSQAIALYVDASHQLGQLLLRSREISIGMAVVGMMVLILFHQRSSRVVTSAVYSMAFLSFLITSAIAHFENLNTGRTELLFSGHKLVFLALSVLVAGPYWLNIVFMLSLVVEVSFLTAVSPMGSRAVIYQAGEPGYTVIYALVAGALLAFRYQYQRLARELVMEKERRELLGELTHIFASIRDLTNTPLQKLEIAAALLQRNPLDHAILVKIVKDSVEKLNFLNRIFKSYEKEVRQKNESLLTEDEILRNLEKLRA